MATLEQCQAALESLTARLSQLDPKQRATNLPEDRTLSCRVPDLKVTFLTKIGPGGAAPVIVARPTAPPAQIRFSASSDDVVAIAADPGTFARAWLTGRLKVEGGFMDLLRLRSLM